MKIQKSFAEAEDLEKINRFSRKELTADELYVFTLTLCDNDIDRDFEKFSLSALNELKELFTGKTGIFDHSMKSADQKARIFETTVEKVQGEVTRTGEQLYRLKAKAYMLKNDENRALIEEIDAGIKKEVSVSCSMGSSVCSICGKNRRAERCGHISGKSYGGKLCFSTLENALDAYEFSFVAVPAQRKAGVTKAFKISEESDMNEIIKTIKSCEGSVELSKSQADSLASYIDNLEEEAQLGEEYKKELSSQVIKLFALHFPQMDSKLFSSVVSVMTVKELLGFKKGFEKTGEAAEPQLAPNGEKPNKKDYSQFKI